MSASGGGDGRAWRLVTNFGDNFGSLGAAVAAAIGGVISAIGLGATNITLEGADLLAEPLNAMGNGAANIASSFTNGVADIIGQGAVTTIESFSVGALFDLGPFTFPVSIFAAMLGLWVVAQTLQTAATSDTLPGTFTDLPFLGADEEEEE